MPHLIDHNKNIIEVQNVSFAYGGQKVLEDVSLNVHLGDYLGIVGPNGGGKTTLLKIMLGLLKPDSGIVKLFGENISNFKAWSKIGYVPQKATNFDVNFPATVEEVVTMGLYGKLGLFKFISKEDQKVVSQAISQVEMTEFRSRLVGDLSGGQQQRVFIARALVSRPEVVILDEPTVGVDAQTQEQFYLLLKKLNDQMNLTLVLVSHDIDVVANETTEVACINGTVTYHGSPKEFVKESHLKDLYGGHFKYVMHGH